MYEVRKLALFGTNSNVNYKFGMSVVLKMKMVSQDDFVKKIRNLKESRREKERSSILPFV